MKQILNLSLLTAFPIVQGQFLLENAIEIEAVTLMNRIDEDTFEELAKFTLTTAWVETGYSHAKEYTLELMMQIDTQSEMKQGRYVFWYVSWPKTTGTLDDPLYETIFVDYNPTVDTRFYFYETDERTAKTIEPDRKPIFSAAPNILEQELIKGYKQRSFTATQEEYVGWTLLPKLSVEDSKQLKHRMLRPQRYIKIKAGVGVETLATVGLGIQGTVTAATSREITIKWQDFIEKAEIDDETVIIRPEGEEEGEQSDRAISSYLSVASIMAFSTLFSTIALF